MSWGGYGIGLGKKGEEGRSLGEGEVTKEERDTSNVTSRTELEDLVTD